MKRNKCFGHRLSIISTIGFILAITGIGALSVTTIPFTGKIKNPVNHISFRKSTLEKFGQGSDMWHITERGDGVLIAAWGDGPGWDGRDDCSLGITEIRGMPPKLRGTDIFCLKRPLAGGINRKPVAIVAVGNTIYMYYETARLNWNGARLAISYDGGHSFEWGDNNGTGGRELFSLKRNGFEIQGACQFGPGYTGMPARVDSSYIYLYLSDREPDGNMTAKDDKTGKNVWIARVLKSRIANRSENDYEFWDGTGWSRNPANKAAIIRDSDGTGFNVYANYDKGLDLFLLVKNHVADNEYPANGLGVWVGQNPWGPFTRIYHKKFLNNMWKFTDSFPQKWMSPDGKTVWMAFSGWSDAAGKQLPPGGDNLQIVKAILNR